MEDILNHFFGINNVFTDEIFEKWVGKIYISTDKTIVSVFIAIDFANDVVTFVYKPIFWRQKFHDHWRM